MNWRKIQYGIQNWVFRVCCPSKVTEIVLEPKDFNMYFYNIKPYNKLANRMRRSPLSDAIGEATNKTDVIPLRNNQHQGDKSLWKMEGTSNDICISTLTVCFPKQSAYWHFFSPWSDRLAIVTLRGQTKLKTSVHNLSMKYPSRTTS